MKKILITCSLILMFVYHGKVEAQQDNYNWRIGIGYGYSNYYGDLSNYSISMQKAGNIFKLYHLNLNGNKTISNYTPMSSYAVSLERKLTPTFSIQGRYSRHTITGNDRTDLNGNLDPSNVNFSRALNFETKIEDISLGLIFRTDNGKLLKQTAFVAPYLLLDAGITRFFPKADLYDASGNKYNYAPDGSLPNGITPDGVYETSLRPLMTEGKHYNTQTISTGFGLGLRFRLSSHWGIHLESDFRYSFSDYLDDVSGNYPPTYESAPQAYASNPTNAVRSGRGNPNTSDWFAYHSISLRYSFKPRVKAVYRVQAYNPNSYFLKSAQPADTIHENDSIQKAKTITEQPITATVKSEELVINAKTASDTLPARDSAGKQSVPLYKISLISKNQDGNKTNLTFENGELVSISTQNSDIFIDDFRGNENNKTSVEKTVHINQRVVVDSVVYLRGNLKATPVTQASTDSIAAKQKTKVTEIQRTKVLKVVEDTLSGKITQNKKLNTTSKQQIKADSISPRFNTQPKATEIKADSLSGLKGNKSPASVADTAALKGTVKALPMNKNVPNKGEIINSTKMPLQEKLQQTSKDTLQKKGNLQENAASPDKTNLKQGLNPPPVKNDTLTAKKTTLPSKVTTAKVPSTANSKQNPKANKPVEKPINQSADSVNKNDTLSKASIDELNLLEIRLAEKSTKIAIQQTILENQKDSLEQAKQSEKQRLLQRINKMDSSNIVTTAADLEAAYANLLAEKSVWEAKYKSQKQQLAEDSLNLVKLSEENQKKMLQQQQQNSAFNQVLYNDRTDQINDLLAENRKLRDQLEEQNRNFNQRFNSLQESIKTNNIAVQPDSVSLQEAFNRMQQKYNQTHYPTERDSLIKQEFNKLSKQIEEYEIDRSQITALKAGQESKEMEITRLRDSILMLQSKINHIKSTRVTTVPVSTPTTKIEKEPDLLDIETTPVTEVYFTFGSTRVSKKHIPKLAKSAQLLKKHPEAKVKITGMADAVGNPVTNMKISLKRAESVKTILTGNYNINAERIQTKAIGSTNSSKKNALDRKVTIEFVRSF